MPEVGLPRAGGHDKGVVGIGSGRAVGPDRGDDPALQVESGDGGQFHPDVAVAVQDVADRRRDLPFGQDPGRDLVQQRLEQVVVPAVDHGDVDVRPFEEPGGEQPAEAAADNDHPVCGGLAHCGPPGSWPGAAERPSPLRFIARASACR